MVYESSTRNHSPGKQRAMLIGEEAQRLRSRTRHRHIQMANKQQAARKNMFPTTSSVSLVPSASLSALLATEFADSCAV